MIQTLIYPILLSNAQWFEEQQFCKTSIKKAMKGILVSFESYCPAD